MADQTETIQIQVTADGITTVYDALLELGLTADAAAERIVSGFNNAQPSIQATASVMNILGAATRAGVDNIEAYETALQLMTNGEINAASRKQTLTQSTRDFGAEAVAAADKARQLAAGEDAVSNSSDKAAASTSKLGTQITSFGSSMFSATSILQTFVGYLSFRELSQASDAWVTIKSQIQQVTGTGIAFDQALSHLQQTADASGTSLEQNAKLFYNMGITAKQSGVNVNDVGVAIDSVDKIMRATGASTAETSRVLRELSEAAARGTLEGRQLLSILTNSRGIVDALAQATGVSTTQLLAMAKAQSTAAASGTDQAVKQQQASLATEQAGFSAQKAQENYDKLNKTLLATAVTGLKTQADVQKFAQERQALSDAATQRDIANQKLSITEQQAVQASTKATGTQSELTFSKLIELLKQANDNASKLASGFSGTISGAIQAVENDFTVYIGKMNDASGAAGVLRQAILAVGTNINVVVPLVGTLVAAFVLQGAINTVKQLSLGLASMAVTITTEVVPAIYAAATATLSFFLTPAGAAVGALILLIGAFVAASGGIGPAWENVKTVVNAVLGFIGGLLTGVSTALSAMASFIGGVFSTAWTALAVVFTPVWTALGNFVTGVQTDLTALWTWLGNVFVPIWATISTAFTPVWNALSSFVEKAVTDFDNFINAVKNVIDWLDKLFTATEQDAKGFSDEATAAAKVTVPASTSATSGLPHAATGADFIVGNYGGGTDSQLLQMMVSPGERVTVHTPHQVAAERAHHTTSQHAHTGKLPHFAGGGFLDIGTSSIGVTQGLGGVSVQDIASSATNVTGYTPSDTAAFTTTSATTAATTTSASTATTSSASGDVLSSILSALTIFHTAPLAFGRSISAIDYINGVPAATAYVPNWVGAALAKGNDLTIYYKGKSADDIENRVWGAHESGDLQKKYDQQRVAEIVNKNASGGGVGGFIHEDYSLTQSLQRALQSDLNGGAIAWEHDPLNPNIVPNNYTPGASFKFRDGGDLTVGGSGPVDSRIVSMAVSPGETISVRTPQQKAAASAAAGSGDIHMHWNIKTDDPQTIRRAGPQVERDAARTNQKIATRARLNQ